MILITWFLFLVQLLQGEQVKYLSSRDTLLQTSQSFRHFSHFLIRNAEHAVHSSADSRWLSLLTWRWLLLLGLIFRRQVEQWMFVCISAWISSFNWNIYGAMSCLPNVVTQKILWRIKPNIFINWESIFSAKMLK